MIWIFATMKQRPFNLFIFFFFWNLHGRAFCFLNFVRYFHIKASFLLILLKCIVSYSNGMKVSQVGWFQITGRWICYSIFSDISFIVFFTKLLSKCFWRNQPFSAQTLKPISRRSMLQKMRMSNFATLKWLFEYKVKSWKLYPFLGLLFQK